MQLRPYQSATENAIYDAWAEAGVANVAAVLPTGAGKTVIFANVLAKHKGAAVAIAHRQELVAQISVALAREGVRHRIIGPNKVIKLCVKMHMLKVGKAFYDPGARVAVAGVDTLVRKVKDPDFMAWAAGVTLWVQDECHHVLMGNKWGSACDMFPRAKGLGVTATPTRADGKGLGRHADGAFDAMVEGPTMRELINKGYLTDYRIVAPRTRDLNLDTVAVGASGEYVPAKLKKAIRKSTLVGDIVKHYLKFARGKRGVTFASDLETAQEIADDYNAAGVPALMVHGGSSDDERESAVAKLESGEIMNLVNVDLFGEGFDLPAIEVVSMGRPTKSYSLFVQQFGRALRIVLAPAIGAEWDTFTDDERKQHIAQSVKPKALIIDHVGNTDLDAGGHGLPDAPRTWSLDARQKRGDGATDAIPTRVCINPACISVYERIYKTCPNCSTAAPPPGVRSGPLFVDGDLTELSDQALARMRGDVAKLNRTPEEYALDLARAHMPPKYRPDAIAKYTLKHSRFTQYQTALQASIAWWAGMQRAAGRDDSESYKRFFYRFGIDVMSAKGLDAEDALALADKVNFAIGEGIR